MRRDSPLAFLFHEGDAADLIRAVDWDRNSLGSPERWPEALKTALSLALNSRHPMMIMWGPELIQFYNDAYRPSLGREKHPAAMGQPARECWPETWHFFGAEIEAVLATGASFWHRDALVPILREGRLEEVYWTYGYSPIYLPTGAVGGMLAVVTETTDRVAATRERRVEIEKVERLLSLTPTAYFSVTENFLMDYLNPAAERVLGLRLSEVLGRSLWEIFPGLYDSAFGDAYRRAMDESAQVPVVDAYYPEYQRWYEALAFRLETGVGVWFFDITERKLDEAKLQSEKQKFEAIFFGSASPMVLYRGADFVYEIANDPYRQLLPGRQLIGRPLLEVVPELAASSYPTLLRDVFVTGLPHSTHEERATLRNTRTGELEERYFDSGIARIDDSDGRPYGVLVQSIEVTDRVSARRRIEEALAVRDNFLSIASHELRTPITGMKLQAQMLLRSLERKDPQALSPARVERLARQSNASLDRMTRLVGDMLDIARIQEGKLGLNPEPTEFAALVESVLDRFADELAQADISVRFSAEAAGVSLVVDSFRMEQVVTNLITNAIRYAPRAPLDVRVELHPDFCRLSFRDGGPGVAEVDFERVFGRFERLVSASEVSGMGLGLYIVRQIVQMHGGTIYLSRHSGSGANFVMDLPLVRPPT